MGGSCSYSLPEAFAPLKRSWPSRRLTASPVWCAVDLRDGNQAIPNPLEPYQKLAYFQLLTQIGFKEIEIGYPAAAQEERLFCRELIEKELIPPGVTASVLTMARESVIRRTFEAIRGIRDVICHVYIPTSVLHTKFVLGTTPRHVFDRMVQSTSLIRKLAEDMPESRVRLEFSPEEFTDSNMDFIVELCDAVVETWGPRPGEKVIINLPQTVERALPNHYPDMVESFLERSSQTERMVLSLHAHNDMGGAVASTELALLAGGQRVEGTLFGNGERAGNVDLVTLALNLRYLGLDTGLDFHDLDAIAAKVTELTSMPISPRQPYAGELAFAAFSGSHQDAMHKVLEKKEAVQRFFHGWKMPYIHLDPAVIGRKITGNIRINTQSGRGGIAHVLAESYGIQLPQGLLDELAVAVQKRAELVARELRPDEIWDSFLNLFSKQDSPLRLINYWPRPDRSDPSIIDGEVHLEMHDRGFVLHATGNGPVAAFAEALRQLNLPEFRLLTYEERAMGTSVNAESITFVSLLRSRDNVCFHGIGFGANIVQGAARAIISALNQLLTRQ